MKNTYFVFVDPLEIDAQQELPLDNKVKSAFERLKDSKSQPEVIFLSMGNNLNNGTFHDLQSNFAFRLMQDHSIDELPAFICTTEKYRHEFISCNVKNLNNRSIKARILGALSFKYSEGTEQKGIHVPRSIIEVYADKTDTLFCFIRDINVRLSTKGINSAGDMVFQEQIKVKGKKVAKQSSTIIKGF